MQFLFKAPFTWGRLRQKSACSAGNLSADPRLAGRWLIWVRSFYAGQTQTKPTPLIPYSENLLRCCWLSEYGGCCLTVSVNDWLHSQFSLELRAQLLQFSDWMSTGRVPTGTSTACILASSSETSQNVIIV